MKLTGNWRERLFALLLIGGVELTSIPLLSLVARNDFYYVVCALLNALSVIGICVFFDNTDLATDLLKLSFVQMLFQFLGWVMYSLYFQAHFYNWCIHTIVFVTFIRILLVGENDGNPTNYFNRSLFHLSFGMGHKPNKWI